VELSNGAGRIAEITKEHQEIRESARLQLMPQWDGLSFQYKDAATLVKALHSGKASARLEGEGGCLVVRHSLQEYSTQGTIHCVLSMYTESAMHLASHAASMLAPTPHSCACRTATEPRCQPNLGLRCRTAQTTCSRCFTSSPSPSSGHPCLGRPIPLGLSHRQRSHAVLC
jgi:hypothetical protein